MWIHSFMKNEESNLELGFPIPSTIINDINMNHKDIVSVTLSLQRDVTRKILTYSSSNRKRKRNTSHCIATVRSIPLLHSVVEQHSGGAVAVVDVMIFDLPH